MAGRKRCFPIIILAIIATQWLTSPVQAGPITFFRRVFGNHDREQPPRKKRRAEVDSPSPTATPQPVNNDRPPVAPEVAEPSVTPVPAQVATSVTLSPQQRRTDFPYGVPVANKPGFVTSPYSPNGGYVDVRGFASNMEVRDPYTGKIFITP